MAIQIQRSLNLQLFQDQEGLDAVDMGMCVIDAGHYGLEQVFIDDMKDLIRTHFSDMNVITYKAGSPYKVV